MKFKKNYYYDLRTKDNTMQFFFLINLQAYKLIFKKKILYIYSL